MTNHQTTRLASIGAALEYYDFVIYAMLAGYLSILFFPNEDPIASLLQTFGVFALGYLVRPIGGMIFGSLGDRIGRKITFIISIATMGISTFAVGLLPTYAMIGAAAPILLILCRLLQGLSFGAELPGAITFIAEHAVTGKRGWHCGLLFFGVSLGAILGSLMNYLLSIFLTKPQILTWGWRLPFLLGGILAVIGFIIRRNIEETPLFMQQRDANQLLAQPLKTVISNHYGLIIKGIAITFFPASFILINLFFPTYLHEFLHYPLQQVFLVMTLGLVWATVLLPVFGWLSDFTGRKPMLIVASIIVIFCNYALFSILKIASFSALLSFMLLYQTLIAMLAACYPSMLAELFPTSLRYSGVAVCYNTAMAIAGLVPMLASGLIKVTHQPLIIGLMLGIFALVCTIAAMSLVDNTKQALL